MKIKNLSDLGGLYGDIIAANVTVPDVVTENATKAVEHTDTSVYLTENMVKAGSPLGGGPGTKKDIVPEAKKTGPEGLKGNNFKKVDKMEDPGSDKKKMKDEEEGKEDHEASDEADTEAEKNTTSKEKVEETVAENNKYIYKPKFTMSKSKFDQLYLEALKGVPFNENEEAMHGEEEAGIPAATDAAADGEHEMGGEEHAEEATLTHDEAIEAVKKLLAFLEKDKEVDVAHGDLGDEEQEMGATEEEEGMVAEEVEAEDEGHVLTKTNGSLKKGNPDAVSKPVTVGDMKKTAGTADKGKIRNEPEPKEEHGDIKKLQNVKNNKADATGTVSSVGKNLFD
jgi:hypothetical protein